MRKKSLLIVRVNTILSQDKQGMIEEVRQQILKQLKDGVIVTDFKCEVNVVDYDSKKIEVKVIDRDSELIAENK